MSQYTSFTEGGFYPFVGSAGKESQGQAESGNLDVCEPTARLRWALALRLEYVAFSHAPIFRVSR